MATWSVTADSRPVSQHPKAFFFPCRRIPAVFSSDGFTSLHIYLPKYIVLPVTCLSSGHTPSIAFRHLPPNSARIVYAPCLRAAVNRRCRRLPKGLDTNQTQSTGLRHPSLEEGAGNDARKVGTNKTVEAIIISEPVWPSGKALGW